MLRGPHDLRHTWASLALAAGVHPKVVSDRLGHSTIAITIDTYSHAIPSLDADAAAIVASTPFGDGDGCATNGAYTSSTDIPKKNTNEPFRRTTSTDRKHRE